MLPYHCLALLFVSPACHVSILQISHVLCINQSFFGTGACCIWCFFFFFFYLWLLHSNYVSFLHDFTTNVWTKKKNTHMHFEENDMKYFVFGWYQTLSLSDSLLPLLQNQFGYQEPNYSMEDMLATLPRVVAAPPVPGGCLPAQDLAAGGQMGAGFSRGKQDDPRCNGTLRKQASPRSNTLGTGAVPTAGLGNIKS